MSIRILHVLDHSIPLQSGYTFRTLSILREQRALGWQTFHVTSPKHYGATKDEEEVDGLLFYRTRPQHRRIDRLPLLREWKLMEDTARRVEEVARKVKPDLLHAHSPVLNAIPALRIGRRLSIPVVYEVRAFWEDAAVDHGTSREWGVRYRLTRNLETFALKRAHHVTTICDGLRDEIMHRGLPADRVTVIPNAVDTAAFGFDAVPDQALRLNLGLEHKTVLGFVGSFYAYEGLDLLLQALPAIAAQHADVRVLLVGGGPQEAHLRELAARLGVGDRVIFAGRVPHAEVQRYYALIDVLVYPRRSMRLTELVTPLKPLEAMAQGHLVVASDVGGHRELIRDGDTGVLFAAGSAASLASAVHKLLADESRWGDMRRSGRRFVDQERTWRRSVARYAPIYARLAALSA
jgi:PEP-CTERM/exosortase A-associated glycosyltransferase